jgi:hypothetical protein
MKRLILSCLLVVGCTSEYERKYGESEAEYEERASACAERAAASEYVFTLVNTDRWRVGATPLWSTSERLRTTLGPPDTCFKDSASSLRQTSSSSATAAAAVGRTGTSA